MPVQKSKLNLSEISDTQLERWIAIILPGVKVYWANYFSRLPAHLPVPELRDWLALLQIAGTAPDQIPHYLSRFLKLAGTDEETIENGWLLLTDLFELTQEAARAGADQLSALDWQALTQVQHRIFKATALAAAAATARLKEAQQRHKKEQALIYDGIVALGTGLDMDMVLTQMSQKLVEAVGAGACVISRIDEKAGTVTALVEHVSPQSENSPAHTWRQLNKPMPISKDPICRQLLKSTRPIIGRADVKDNKTGHVWQYPAKVTGQNFSWDSFLAIPLETKKHVVGLVEIYDENSERSFSPDDVKICRILATQTASALEQARLFEEMVRRLSEVSMLYMMAEKIASSLNLEDVLNTIVTSLRDVIGCRACCIFLLDETDQQLEIKAADGLKPHWQKMAKLQIGEGAAGKAVAEHRTIYLPDTHQDPEFIFFDKDVRSLMVVPLLAQGRVIGTINVDDRRPRAFDYTQERLLTIAAAQAGIMIENARLFTRISTEQQRMQAIIQHMADGVLLINRRGIIITCNATAAIMLGLDVGQIIEQNISDPDLHPNLASVTATTTQRVRTGVLTREVTIETPRPRHLQVFSTVIVDDQKKRLGEVRLLHDVTKERELELFRDEFFSTVSHELRTPLFSIQGFAQILLEEENLDESTQKEFLKTIQRQALTLGEMVNNLLDLSKFEAGKPELEKVPFLLSEVIEQTVLKLQGFAHQQEVELLLDIAGGLPIVYADVQRFEQVLTNLIGNAIKFSETGQKVNITASVVDNEILVQVKDRGIGVPAEDLEQIFSRYYQAANRGDKTAKGTGLGLYIAKKIIEGHGGRIWAESEIGQGSSFSFTLPLEDTNFSK